MTYLRVAQRLVTLTPNSDGFYDVQLTLTNKSITPVGTGEGSTGGFPYTPPEPAAPTEFCCTQTVTNGGAQDIRSEAPFRYSLPADIAHHAIVHIAAFSVTGDLPGGDWVGLSLAHSWNGGSLDYAAIKSQVTFGQPGYPGGTQNVCWNAGALSACSGTEGGTPPTFTTTINNPGGGGTNKLEIFGISGLSGSTANVTFCLSVGAVYDDATGLEVPNEIPPASQPGPPGAAQWVRGETVGPADGTTTTFYTDFPFADGSLVVYVDRLDQTAAVVSYDGACGEFTLGFAPQVGELIEVDYQGR